MTQIIDYKKIFSKLSHIKALSHNHKFDEIVQQLITYTLIHLTSNLPKNDREVSDRIKEVYGITIREGILQSNLDKLLKIGEISRDPISREYILSKQCSQRIKQRTEESHQLEAGVKEKWFAELDLHFKDEPAPIDKEILWSCLKSYLSNVFEQHGIETLRILNPSTRLDMEDQRSLLSIVQQIARENKNNVSLAILISAINQFINNADLIRTNYLSQLADASFTSFALTSDAETVNFLNKRYNPLNLFLDTNFIFGILDLHKNNEDKAAREILDEVKKNNLPFTLCYHPETLAEFKRTLETKALLVSAAKWTRESSRVALHVGGLSPLEELFHKTNVENETDPLVFLDKYKHVDLILKDVGFIEYVPKRVDAIEHVEIEADIAEYQLYYDSVPNRKIKSFFNFKHDVVVIREVRSLNPKKTKFLDSNAFFISSDFVLGKFEKKYYKKSWEINYVVSPSVFLQLVRPFIESDYNSNKRFIDTFSIPELRTFQIDYSATRSTALQILNDHYHSSSMETKVQILRDQVLLEKLSRINDDDDARVQLIESHIAIMNRVLLDSNKQMESDLNVLKKRQEELEWIQIASDMKSEQIQNEKHALLELNDRTIKELHAKDETLTNLKETYRIQSLRHQKKSTQDLLTVLEVNRAKILAVKLPLDKMIDNKFDWFKFKTTLIPLSYALLMYFLIYKIGWEKMEPITYLLSLAFVIGGYLYFAIHGHDPNPKGYFSSKRKDIEFDVYREFNFTFTELNEIESRISAARNSLKELEAQMQTV